jgi:hypothetical protein
MDIEINEIQMFNQLNLITMDKKNIAHNAGIVWRLLDNNNRRWEYGELKEASGLSDRDLNTAIGWLARENRVQFEQDNLGNRYFLYLEMNLYIG